MKTLSVVIPVYQNQDSLINLYKELISLQFKLSKMNIGVQIIFVDDGSTDDSYSILCDIANNNKAIKVIKLSRNFGAVQATKTGFRFITGDCFTYLSADLQDPPNLLIELVCEWMKGYKLVIAERTSRDDPYISVFFSSLYYWALKRFALPDFPQGGFDMAVMDKELLLPILNTSKNTHLAPLIFWLGYTPLIVPYKRQKRINGKSMWTFSKKMKAFLDALLGFSIAPIRAISLTGYVVSLMSLGYGIFRLIHSILFGNEVPGFTTLACLISFLLGIIIIMLGIIGEYLWRLYDNTNGRPEAIVDKIIN